MLFGSLGWNLFSKSDKWNYENKNDNFEGVAYESIFGSQLDFNKFLNS